MEIAFNILKLLILGTIIFTTQAQNIGIGTATPHSKAILHIEDSTRVFLPPRMTTAQRDTMTNIPRGGVIFNVTTNCLEFWNGSQWISTCASTAPCVAPPKPDPGSNSPVCAGQTINLTASSISGATYVWTGPSSFYSTNQNPSITNAASTNSGNYCVRVYVAGCYSEDTCVNVQVIDPPGTWTPKASYIGTYPVRTTAGFIIGNDLYIIGGRRSDLACCIGTNLSYKYNISTNTWSSITPPPLPGGIDGQIRAGFEDGTYGYVVGGGLSSSSPFMTNKCYRYNTTTDSWSTMNNYPDYSYAIHSHTVVINGDAYTVGGEIVSGASAQNTNRFRQYDISTNLWTNSGFIGGNSASAGRGFAFIFAINDTIYYGTGRKWSPSCCTDYNEYYRYVPATNTHTLVGNAPFSGASYTYFSIGRYGYVFKGATLWRYDVDANTWMEICTPIKDNPDIAFVVGGKAYIIDTDDDNGDGTKEFWEWIP